MFWPHFLCLFTDKVADCVRYYALCLPFPSPNNAHQRPIKVLQLLAVLVIDSDNKISLESLCILLVLVQFRGPDLVWKITAVWQQNYLLCFCRQSGFYVLHCIVSVWNPRDSKMLLDFEMCIFSFFFDVSCLCCRFGLETNARKMLKFVSSLLLFVYNYNQSQDSSFKTLSTSDCRIKLHSIMKSLRTIKFAMIRDCFQQPPG